MKKWSFFLVTCSFLYGYITAAPTPPVETIFTEIYEKAGWGRNDQGIGYSGLGSTVEHTQTYRQFIEDFIRENYITSVVDLGCGDWTFSKLIDWQGATYLGIDVVKPVIEENIRLYSSPTIEFRAEDIINADLPRADLLICKDVLMHLTNEDVQIVLQKIGGFKHCIFTHDVDFATRTAQNGDISRGGFRHVDLRKSPFYLPAVDLLYYVNTTHLKQVLYYSPFEK